MTRFQFDRLKGLIIADGVAPHTALKLIGIYAPISDVLSISQMKIIKPYMYKSTNGYTIVGYRTDRSMAMTEVLEETYQRFEMALASGQEININLY
jgi:hypothetical protein